MKQFQVFRYIKKYQAVIAACSILSGVFFYWFANRYLQSYTASAVIEYTDSGAENGQAPNGSPIDTSEIYSSAVVSKAVASLGLSTEQVNIDAIRASIQVEEIITDEEQKTIDANIDQGIENTFHPTRYLVTFTVGSGAGGEYARAVLDEVLEVYTAYYGENYVNTSGSVNGISDIYSKDYDYIEMLETIDASVDSAMTYINDKMSEDDHFRSYGTGYSFRDLYNEFAKISENEIPKLSAEVLSRQITKNRDVLLAKYQKRNNDMAIENNSYTEQIDKLIQIIDSYVEMMSESDNTNITSEYILQGVFGYYDENGNVLTGDKTTEYDQLLDNYVTYRSGFENNLISTAYNQYVLDVFATAPAVSTQEEMDEIEGKIQDMVERINTLYSIFDLTNDEYNEKLGASSIAVLSSVGVTEGISIQRYTALVVVLFGVIGCLGVVFLGRVEDIIDYYAFTNKLDGLPNRAKCDRYIANMERKVLSSQFSCLVFQITNLKEENQRLGRSAGDGMMKDFADILRGVFAQQDNTFVGYNGSGQYLVFAENLNQFQTEAAVRQMESMAADISANKPYQIQFRSGCANADQEQCFQIRKLLSIAMQRVNQKERPLDRPADALSAKSEAAAAFAPRFRQKEDYYEKFLKMKQEEKKHSKRK